MKELNVSKLFDLTEDSKRKICVYNQKKDQKEVQKAIKYICKNIIKMAKLGLGSYLYNFESVPVFISGKKSWIVLEVARYFYNKEFRIKMGVEDVGYVSYVEDIPGAHCIKFSLYIEWDQNKIKQTPKTLFIELEKQFQNNFIETRNKIIDEVSDKYCDKGENK